MRLTSLFIVATGVILAANAHVANVSGVWVAIIDRCDFGTAPTPVRLVMNVTKDENRLDVIEVLDVENGSSLVERQYVLHRGSSPIGSTVARAKITGRTAVLQSPERLEEWRISDDGSELTVVRWNGSSTAHHQIVIFQRSQPHRETPTLQQNQPCLTGSHRHVGRSDATHSPASSQK